jgi:uncharacterized peroxidase-related enzyme
MVMSGWNEPRIKLQPIERIQEVVQESFSEESRTHFFERSAIVDGIDNRDVPSGYESKIDWALSLHRALAWDPVLHDLWYTLEYHTLKEGTVDPQLKELLAVLVNDTQQCKYCVTWHSAAARTEGARDQTIDIVRDFERRKHELREDWRVTLEFAKKVATDHTRIAAEEVDALRKVGYDDAQIVEIVAASLAALMLGRFNVVLNLGE